MKKIFRLITILSTLGRYRLDELLPKGYRPVLLRIILWPFKLRGLAAGERGARLRKALEDLGPIFVKFGQLLSTRPDLIPEDLVAELNKLQDDVAPFDGALFQQLVEQALGDSVANLFAQFDTTPLASASIAQVHCATLHSGEDVVVKAVRPNIESTIRQDVALMAIGAKFLQRYLPDGRRLKPVEVVEEYKQTIYDELNLMREAANASQLRRNFESSELLYVPEIYWDYCRINVMVMERISGARVTDTARFKANNVNIKKLAERGVEIFFTQVFDHNFFHADMHPGNVFVSLESPDSPTYIALDMAIIGTLSRQDQFYLARNMLAMFRRDYRQVAELHVLSGWVPKGTSIGAFESAIRTVCEPLFEKPIKDIAFGQALIILFQTARRFEMPVQPQLVLLQKTLVNIEGLGRQLYPDLDLWATAHPYLERWLKARFHPKMLFGELKRQAPEWMEKFPEVPHLALETVENLKTFTQTAPELSSACETINNNDRRRLKSRRRKAIGALALIFAGFFAWPLFSSLPIETLLLSSIALIAFVLS